MNFEDIYYKYFKKKEVSSNEEIEFEKKAMQHKGCAYCKDCIPIVSWWCKNEEAIKARGTRIPGIIQCPYFTFDKDKIQYEK